MKLNIYMMEIYWNEKGKKNFFTHPTKINTPISSVSLKKITIYGYRFF